MSSASSCFTVLSIITATSTSTGSGLSCSMNCIVGGSNGVFWTKKASLTGSKILKRNENKSELWHGDGNDGNIHQQKTIQESCR